MGIVVLQESIEELNPKKKIKHVK